MALWVNTRAVTFANVDELYAVAASRPIADIVFRANATLTGSGSQSELEAEATEHTSRWTRFALALEHTQTAGGCSPIVRQVDSLGERLFRRRSRFVEVPTGQ